MSERTRRIIFVVIGLGFAAMSVEHHFDAGDMVAAVCFFLTAVLPWSWHGWHERRPADPQN